MELGISTYTYAWAIGIPGKEPDQGLDYGGLIHKAHALDVGLIQLADNLPLDRLEEAELTELRNRADSEGIQLEAGARGMTESNLERYIGIAGKINSPILRFVIDGADFVPEMEEIHALIRNALPVLKEKNIILALENYERLKARDFAEIVEKAGSANVGICLDCVNSMGAGEGIETVVGILADMTVNLHIKEFSVKRIYHQLGFHIEGKPAGEGMLDIPWLLGKMPEACRSAILEQWVPPEPGLASEALSSTIRKEDEWARKSIEYLKPFFNSRYQ